MPYIVNKDKNTDNYESVIVQSPFRVGKIGAFLVGAISRVNTRINKAQVIVLGHTLERADKIGDIVRGLISYSSDHSVCNLARDNGRAPFNQKS